jgi:ribosomal protein L7/L12
MARRDEEVIALRRRVSKLERQVNFLLNHLQINYPEETDSEITQEIIELVRMGRKIEAIRLYRELTGVGLKEAKEAVEAL